MSKMRRPVLTETMVGLCRLRDLTRDGLNMSQVRLLIKRLHDQHGGVIVRTKQKRGSAYLVNMTRLREVQLLDSKAAKGEKPYVLRGEFERTEKTVTENTETIAELKKKINALAASVREVKKLLKNDDAQS